MSYHEDLYACHAQCCVIPTEGIIMSSRFTWSSAQPTSSDSTSNSILDPAPLQRTRNLSTPVAPEPTHQLTDFIQPQAALPRSSTFLTKLSTTTLDEFYSPWVHNFAVNQRTAPTLKKAARTKTLYSSPWEPIPIDGRPDFANTQHRKHDFTAPCPSLTRDPMYFADTLPVLISRELRSDITPPTSTPTSSFSIIIPPKVSQPKQLVKPYYQIPKSRKNRLLIKGCICMVLLALVIGTLIPLGPYINEHMNKAEQVGVIVGVCGGLTVVWGVVISAF